MMKRKLLFILFTLIAVLGLSNILWAQEVPAYEIQGRILDRQSKPIPLSSVRLLSIDESKMLVGEMAKSDGSFALKVKSRIKEAFLEVRFVGYITQKKRVKLGGQTKVILEDIILEEDLHMLKEVTVIGKATEVVVKGDTIEYNASSYTVAEGEALEALLKKIPGAEVNESGDIVINGKSISKIMVDGKRFFESDPKVALKNLPADLIDKVQVLDRGSDNARMTGFADGEEETIINLTVKKGKKQGVFGSAYAGVGTDKRYEGSAAVNRFTDSSQWSILVNANNTNNSGFTDIGADISESGLMSQMGTMRRRGVAPTAPMNDGVMKSVMLGANLAYTFPSLGELSSGAFWGRTNKDRSGKSYTTNFISSGNTVEHSETREHNLKNTTGANLRLEWKPNSRTEVIIAPQFNHGLSSGIYSSSTDTQEENTNVLINSNTVAQTTQGSMWRSEIRANASYRFESGRTLALSTDWSHALDDTEGTYLSSLHSLGEQATVDQYLKGRESRWSVRSRLSYVEPLGRGYALQLLYQYRLERTQSLRDAYEQHPSTEQYTLRNEQYSNRFDSDFSAHRASIALKKSNKVYDITAGFNVDPSLLNSYTISSGKEHNVVQPAFNYSPTLRFKYKPSKAFDLGIDYRGRSFQPSAHQLSPVQDITNQLVVYQGNPNLKPGYRHNLFARISLFKASRQSSLMFFAHLQYVQSDIVSRSLYNRQTGIRYIDYANVDGNGRIEVGGFFSAPLFNKILSIRISTQNMLTRQIGFVEGVRNSSHTLRLSESIALAYRRGIIDTSLKGSWTFYSSRHSLASMQTQATHDYRIEWDNQIRLGGFTIESSTNYRTTSGYVVGFDRDQWIINLSMSYHFLRDKSATIRFKVYDLLAQQQNIYRSASALSVSTHEANILGRYAMLHFIYKFNKFGSNASKRPIHGTLIL